MQQQILNIISKSKEPVYDLGLFYNKLTDIDKKKFIEEVRLLIVSIDNNVSNKDKYVILTMLSVEDFKITKEIFSYLINNADAIINIYSYLLPPLIYYCTKHITSDNINFIEKILKNSLLKQDEYLIDISLFALIKMDINRAISYVKNYLLNAEKDKIIDTLSYIHSSVSNERWNNFSKDNKINEIINKYNDDIIFRSNNHYKS